MGIVTLPCKDQTLKSPISHDQSAARGQNEWHPLGKGVKKGAYNRYSKEENLCKSLNARSSCAF